MATVDSLNIQITAQANSASASIDKLSKKLNTLSVSLNSINGSGLSGLSNSVQRLGKSMQTLNGVKTTDFTRIAKGFERFAKIDVSGLSKASGGLNTLARSLSSLSSIQNLGNITPAINAIKNLARVNMGRFDTTKLQEISNSVNSFANKLSSIGEIDSKVVRLVNAMARLSGSGQYISNVTTSFPLLGKQVVKLVKNLSGAGSIDANITKVVDGIARLASAGKKAGETAANMQKLGDSVMNLLNRLKNAPAINANIANTIQGLGNLAASGSRISTVANNAGTSGIKLGNAFRTLKDKISGVNKSFKGFVSNIGMFYAKAFLLIRAVKKLGGAIGSAQDYIEEFNYFSVALDKIGKDSANQFKEAGYDSAEEYAKSFRSRFAKLQKQMTGYEVDYDTGDAASKGIHNLGLDLTKVMNFNAAIAQITNSAGMLGETSIMTSKALSMLSADWSSLSNQDLSDVMNNMQSALIGQSRAVYKYGIDITSAGLAQTAMNHGLEVSIKDLSQQSKMQLRVLTMLEQSKVAYGDLARTINQPANQLRMLQAGFKNLSRSIGNLFLPVVQKIYPYLNAIVMVLQQFVQWVAKIAGIKLGDISGVSLPDMEEPTDGMDDYADATDKAAKKQKKLNDNLQGFDIINKLQKNESDSGDGDDGGKKNTNLDLSGDIAAALKGYEKIWDKAFKDNQNKAVQLAQKIKKALLDGWNRGGDFTELGKKLGAWINKGMEKIPWGKIKQTTNKVVKSVATFLNGLVDSLDWKLLGENIAEGLNTAVGAAYTWWTTFDWLQFGTSLATMLNSALNKFDATLLGKTLGAKLRGIVQAAFGFVENFDFSQFGKKISNAINGFFKEMGEVDSRTGLTGWQEMGKTISDSISGILTTINTALKNVKWEEVGKAISGLLTSIDWWGIFANLIKTLSTVLKSVVTTAIFAIAQDPAGMIKALTGMFAILFSAKQIKSIISAFKPSMKSEIASGVAAALGGAGKSTGIAGAIKSFANLIGALFKGSLRVSLANAMAGTGISATIFKGLSTAFSAVSGKVAALGAKLSAALTSQAFLASFAPVAIAVAGAVVSGKLIADRLKEAIDAINFTGDYELKVPEGMKKASEEAQKSFENTAKSVEDTKNRINELNKSVETTNGEKVKDLADKYFELSQKTNPTASDIAVMKQYSEELSTHIPGLTKNIDKETGAFKGSREQLNGMVSSLERAAKAQAAYNISVELYEKQLQGKKNIDKKKKEYEHLNEVLKRQEEILEAQGERFGRNHEVYQKQAQIVGTYSNRANAARLEVEKLEEEQKVLGEQIKKNNNVMNNAKVSTKKYEEASKSLKEKMKDLGVSSKDQKKIIEELNTAVDNGEIKWKEYKEVVDGNYTSVGELNGAIQNLSPKEVKVSASVQGKEEVKGLKTSVDDLPSQKSLEVGFKLGGNLQSVINNAIKSLDIAPITVKLRTPSGKSLEEAARTTLAGLTKAFGKTGGMPTSMKPSVPNTKNKTVKVDKNNFMEIPLWKMSGYTVATYELGGFPPEDGWFRANHGEIMGRFDNGQSVVANNKHITDGIAQAVGPAVYSAVKSAINEQNRQGGGEKMLVVDKNYREIATGIVREINSMTRSRGASPLLST